MNKKTFIRKSTSERYEELFQKRPTVIRMHPAQEEAG
jgi:hypothetical protein